MAKQRTKSRHDIIQQYNRLYQAWEDGRISDSRMASVERTKDRYLSNINNMKSSQNAFLRDRREMYLNNGSSFPRTLRMNQRQVARSTYMGLGGQG